MGEFSKAIIKQKIHKLFIGKYITVWKNDKFSTNRFYVKSLFDAFKISKRAILTILKAVNVNFGKFLHFLKVEIYQNQTFRAGKSVKMADFELLQN